MAAPCGMGMMLEVTREKKMPGEKMGGDREGTRRERGARIGREMWASGLTC